MGNTTGEGCSTKPNLLAKFTNEMQRFHSLNSELGLPYAIKSLTGGQIAYRHYGLSQADALNILARIYCP